MKSRRIVQTLFVAMLILAGAMLGEAQIRVYVVTPLGFAGGSFPPALNKAGEVVGSDSTNTIAFLYSHYSLYTIPGNGATAINNLGQIAVYLSGRGYIYDRNRGQSIDVGDLGGGITWPLAMNDDGFVVGESLSGTQYHAFRSYSGRILDLGNLGTGVNTSMATAINKGGRIAGVSKNDLGYWRAFQWVKGTMSDLDPSALTYHSYAYAINDSNQIVGSSDKAGCKRGACPGSYTYPVLYSGGSNNSIGSLGGINGDAYGINNLGDIVGWSSTSTGAHHAFLYSGGQMIDLNYIAGYWWTLTDAYAINEAGEIVCRGIDPYGRVQILLLSPPPA